MGSHASIHFWPYLLISASTLLYQSFATGSFRTSWECDAAFQVKRASSQFIGLYIECFHFHLICCQLFQRCRIACDIRGARMSLNILRMRYIKKLKNHCFIPTKLHDYVLILSPNSPISPQKNRSSLGLGAQLYSEIIAVFY